MVESFLLWMAFIQLLLLAPVDSCHPFAVRWNGTLPYFLSIGWLLILNWRLSIIDSDGMIHFQRIPLSFFFFFPRTLSDPRR